MPVFSSRQKESMLPCDFCYNCCSLPTTIIIWAALITCLLKIGGGLSQPRQSGRLVAPPAELDFLLCPGAACLCPKQPQGNNGVCRDAQ